MWEGKDQSHKMTNNFSFEYTPRWTRSIPYNNAYNISSIPKCYHQPVYLTKGFFSEWILAWWSQFLYYEDLTDPSEEFSWQFLLGVKILFFFNYEKWFIQKQALSQIHISGLSHQFNKSVSLTYHTQSQNWHHQAKIPPERNPSYIYMAWWRHFS